MRAIISGLTTESMFKNVMLQVGFEPVELRGMSGPVDCLICVSGKWLKVQVKRSHSDMKKHRFHSTAGRGGITVPYKKGDFDIFAVEVDGEFYLLPFDHVYRESGVRKSMIHIETDQKYKLSNILKSYKNGKYYVGDEIIF